MQQASEVTMFTLFPLAICLGVVLITWKLLGPIAERWVWIIAPMLGLLTWKLYHIALRWLGGWVDRKQSQKDKEHD